MARKFKDTKKMTYEEWVELRKSSIGGSDAATCVGMNKYSSLITLYADKKGLSKPIEDNEAMRLGRDLEQYVADRYAEKTGNKVRNDFFMYQDDEYDFITANIDRRIVGENAGLECKTMSSFNGFNLENNEVPSHYYCQCQHYMMVMGFDRVDLAILVLQRGLYVIPIERNDSFIQKLREAEIEFWHNCIEQDNIPAPDGSDSSLDVLKQLYPTAHPDTSINIPDLDYLIDGYKDAAEMAKHYEDIKKTKQAEICKLLGDNEVAVGDKYGCSWKNQSKISIDTKRLKAEMPEIYAKYSNVSDYRVFRTKNL